MTDNPVLPGRRLDSPHSPSKAATLTIMHFRDWDSPVDYQAQAREIMAWLGDHLSAGTLACLEWDRDALQEVRRLRGEVERLTRMLAEGVRESVS
jgi:hypothetical protein